jgi:hypothetical protein
MSWDIFVMDLPKDAKSVDEIPQDFKGEPLGKRADLIAAIQSVASMADFSDPTWGTINGPDWSIEVSLGEEDVCGSFAFHVRGGYGAAGVVAAILDRLQLRALDSGSGDFFVAVPEAEASFQSWREYRDQVVSDAG